MLTRTQASQPEAKALTLYRTSPSTYGLPGGNQTQASTVWTQASNNLTPRQLHVHPETQGGNRASQISPSVVVQARSAGTLPSSSFQIHSLLCVPSSFHPDYCQEPPHVSPTGSHLKAGQSFCYINLIISLLCLKSASAYFSN